MSIEPCLCGAPDCPRCHPQNFRGGRYRFAECQGCGREFEPADGEKLCEKCESKKEDVG